ncbi:catechol 1,2-dioxygenase [Prescottella agglutinans]|uniref:Catechol 1,2-dioxygenase n=1 Tax=Prescottella agglutinans TaxID=1644129 RepID=A0A438BC81_9NOCA|nr:catechol 1,2-dioxygenase [Prescottella agglutinans]RVW08471.1 catechol 1,2-dioxygenase [Prescottella agglutinans]
MFFPVRFRWTTPPAPTTTAPTSRPLVLEGRIEDCAGRALPGATVIVRHSDGTGTVRAGTRLAATGTADRDGRFAVTTVQPAPYRIPRGGPTGWFIAHEGWHPWRPAHLHVIVRAPGMYSLSTRLYFRRDDWIRHGAPTRSILDPRPGADGTDRAEYHFTLEAATQPTSTYSAYPTPAIASPPNVPA